jgi:cysteine synthase A
VPRSVVKLARPTRSKPLLSKPALIKPALIKQESHMIYNSILDTIGQTPLVRLNHMAPANQTIYAKVEAFNPAGSVKDRLAIAIIEDAEKRGTLKPGQTVIEATSGNTGIALAMVCAAKGYPFVATMVETFSIERRRIMKAFGAKVILTPAAEKGSGMVKRADELAEKYGWFRADQFENQANPAFHRNTTGAEILSDMARHNFDYFVSGWGTGGTITGAGEMIKLARPDVKIIAAEPENAQMMAGQPWTPHKIQGWTPDFMPGVLNKDVADQIVGVPDDAAMATAQKLASREGIFCGISCGATMWAALQVANDAPPNSTMVVMLPDTGERYLSTVLFEHISSDSDDEWLDSLKR